MILSNSDSYVFNSTYLQKNSGLGIKRYYTIIAHLIELGYLEKNRIQHGVEWIINEVATTTATEQHNEAETAQEDTTTAQQQEELNISIDNNITCDNSNDTIESIEDIIEENNTINEIEESIEDKIITINNNNNMENAKKVLLNEQPETKKVINEYQFGKLLEQNNISKRMIQLVNVYEQLGFEKMLNSEKEEYSNNIDNYNSLLSNYQLIQC